MTEVGAGCRKFKPWIEDLRNRSREEMRRETSDVIQQVLQHYYTDQRAKPRTKFLVLKQILFMTYPSNTFLVWFEHLAVKSVITRNEGMFSHSPCYRKLKCTFRQNQNIWQKKKVMKKWWKHLTTSTQFPSAITHYRSYLLYLIAPIQLLITKVKPTP